ncbi:uncharacterized protein LOC119593814 [Penaeus monodon]|uniref:uncharacterized protein LOC119593814 n=1 Tax=Penaeus monodon TaxID=6687 RepID=UPI0018A70AE0|nr:uncharacterized protein LOC119593814 [Penaeus monodon]
MSSDMDLASEKIFNIDASNGNLFNSNITVPYGSLEVANYSLTLLAIGVLIGALISLLLEMARNGPSGIADAIVRGVDAVRLDGMFNSIGSAVENGVNSIPIKRTGPVHAVPAGTRRRRR